MQGARELEALLDVAVLVGVDSLNDGAAREDDGMVLVVTLAVAEDGVARQLDAELRIPPQGGGREAAAGVDRARSVPRPAVVPRPFIDVRHGEEWELCKEHLRAARVGGGEDEGWGGRRGMGWGRCR